MVNFTKDDWEFNRREVLPQQDGERGPVRYRMPQIIPALAEFEVNLTEVQSQVGQRTWTAQTHNATASYEMQVNEDASFITIETEIARVVSPAPTDLYKRLHEINAAISDAKLVVETDIGIGRPNELCDSIHVVKQLRKLGVPETNVLREFSAFDGGVERMTPAVAQAIDFAGATYFQGTTMPTVMDTGRYDHDVRPALSIDDDREGPLSIIARLRKGRLK